MPSSSRRPKVFSIWNFFYKEKSWIFTPFEGINYKTFRAAQILNSAEAKNFFQDWRPKPPSGAKKPGLLWIGLNWPAGQRRPIGRNWQTWPGSCKWKTAISSFTSGSADFYGEIANFHVRRRTSKHWLNLSNGRRGMARNFESVPKIEAAQEKRNFLRNKINVKQDIKPAETLTKSGLFLEQGTLPEHIFWKLRNN